MPIEGDESALSGSGAAGGTLVGRDEVLDKNLPFRATREGGSSLSVETPLPSSFAKRLLKRRP